jgi:fibronectin type 3 domain-containing protein
MLKSKFYYLLLVVAALIICAVFFTTCADTSNNGNDPTTKPDNPSNPNNTSGNTWVEFKNLEQFPVTIYSDPARQVVFAEVPANGTKKVSAEPAPAGMAFYPTFKLVYPISTINITIPYNGPSITAAIMADKSNTVSISKLESIVINSAYIVLINGSNFSLSFNEGPLEKAPLGGGSGIINYGQNAAYEINPGSVSKYSIMRNTTIPVAYPAELTEFKAGIIYVLTYNGTALTLTSQNSILQTVPPETPVNIKAEVVSSNSVKISWDAVYGATGYRVYRTTGSATASYSQVANIAELSWTDTGLNTGTIYYYKVSAASGINMVSAQSEAVLAITPPTNVRVTTVSTISVTLGWNAISGVNSYNVYRSTSEGGTYTKINSSAVSGTEYTDTSLSPDTRYYYKVSAIFDGIESLQSSSVSTTTLSSVPSNLRITTATTTSIRFTWNSVSEASGYNIYRSASENGTYIKINSSAVSGTEYTDTGVTAYTTYYYKVSAFVGGAERGMSSLVSASTGIIVPGNGLATKLAWLQSNAISNSFYYIELNADENIGSQSLSYSGKSGITITLNGGGTMRAVNLSSNGSLFTINSGVTLILDNNVTLRGRNNNTYSTVIIYSGGRLVMNTGAKITGNTSTTSSYGGGVDNSGTFTMNGGEISDNISSGNSSYGGGVYNNTGGTFTMNGGEISGNTLTCPPKVDP